MKALTLLLLLAMVTAAFAAEPLLPSRVAYAPLLAKLKRAGGDPARVLPVARLADLLRLRSGVRYKFAQPGDRSLRLAPAPADEPKNEYSHPVLAGGGSVLTAGGIVVVHDRSRVQRVTLDQDSKSYCPSLASLTTAVAELVRIGLPREQVATQDRPPVCEPSAQRPAAPAAGSSNARDGAR